MLKLTKRILTSIISILLSFQVCAKEATLEFQQNPKIQEAATAYSLDCVDWVKSTFNVELDWSDSSVERIEALLNNLSQAAQSPNPPPPERIRDFTYIFGFYIGEVYRKNHGGVEWGDVIINGDKYVGLAKTDSGEPFIWPTVKVHKRIALGEEENIWQYYQAITEK